MPDYRRDFETTADYRRRLARASGDDDATHGQSRVHERKPSTPASDLVSDTSETRGNIVERVRVYANGTRITSWSFADGWTPPPGGGDGVKPGNVAAAAAFKAGREEEYIDRMQGRFGGEW